MMSHSHPKPWPPVLLLVQIQLVVARSLLPPAGTYANHTSIQSVPCLPDQSSALLRLRRSFSATGSSAAAFRSWRAGTDCCRWEGVRCGEANGLVTSLDLGGCGLQSGRLDPALFKLTSLMYLNLGGNDFNMSELPSMGFEQLTKLTHLNLSTCRFSGQIPYSIGRLVNLISLDLSSRSEIYEIFEDRYVIFVYADADNPWQIKVRNFTNLVAELSHLRELRLSFVDLSNEEAQWCDALSKYTPNLRVLSMPFCRLSSHICGSLAGMQSLSVIDLHYNRLTGPVPEFVANSSLSVLQLSYNYLEGWVSPLIFQNKELVTINLHRNYEISGNLPNFSGDSNLENLLVGHTNFFGAIPSSVSTLKNLKKLDLGSRGFTGELPSSIGKIKTLNSLEVSGLTIVGLIPSWITNITSLEVLKFSHCGLYGPIPSFISDLNKLRTLTLYDCNFSGEIPPSIYNLTQLDTLYLNSNKFIGTVELNSLWKLPNLFGLTLSNNKLNIIDGDDNSSSAPFPSIADLNLASCNITKFPNILRHLNEIRALDLSNNQLYGVIPAWAWEKLTSIEIFSLNLSHNKFTNIDYDTFLPLRVRLLDLSFNMFEGQIPIPQHSGTIVDYSNNRFSSMPLNISTQFINTIFFRATRNNLSGKIPPYFCSIKLKFLDLSYNMLGGSIPSCLFKNADALQVLNLKENQLQGELHHNISKSCTFKFLDFSDNWIEGQLPRSLAYCKKLEILDVGNNQFSGSFPCWMATIHTLEVIVLKSNKFSGEVSPSVTEERNNCVFPSLHILDLASNNFSGTLIEEWFLKLKSMIVKSANDKALVMEYEGMSDPIYQLEYEVTITLKGFDITVPKILRTFIFIDISNNAFHGIIPRAIGQLVLLKALNLSHNYLEGAIPSQLGSLKQLEALDISSNKLSGEIPNELASLDFLTTLSMSDNMLEGEIPESPHFSSFPNSSFMGNAGLCGPPLSKQCSNVKNLELHPSEKKAASAGIFLFAGLGFGVGFAISITVYSPRSRA